MVQLFLLPLVGILFVSFQNDYLIRNSLFGCATWAAGITFTHYLILGNQNIYEVTYMYFCHYFLVMVIMPLELIIMDWLLLKFEANRHSSKFAEFLCRFSMI